MAGPVYKFFMGRVTDAWWQLSDEERDRLMAKVNDCLVQVGGKSILMCNSVWASEQTQFWGVEEFPDIEAVQKLAQLHEELNWYRYVDSKTILGTKWE
jgi:hypothetical protein